MPSSLLSGMISTACMLTKCGWFFVRITSTPHCRVPKLVVQLTVTLTSFLISFPHAHVHVSPSLHSGVWHYLPACHTLANSFVSDPLASVCLVEHFCRFLCLVLNSDSFQKTKCLIPRSCIVLVSILLLHLSADASRIVDFARCTHTRRRSADQLLTESGAVIRLTASTRRCRWLHQHCTYCPCCCPSCCFLPLHTGLFQSFCLFGPCHSCDLPCPCRSLSCCSCSSCFHCSCLRPILCLAITPALLQF